MMFEHTEKAEMTIYGIFGFLMASLPIFIKIFSPRLSCLSSIPKIDFLKKVTPFLGVALAGVMLKFLYPFSEFSFRLWCYYVVILGVLIWVTYAGAMGKRESKIMCGCLFAIFFAWTLIVNFSTAFADPDCTHWGAYLTSVRSIESGSVILNDFPTQYGLGPTLFIYALSGLGGLTAMFYMVGFLQVIFWLSFAIIGLVIVGRKYGKNPYLIGLTLFIVTGAIYYWGYDVRRYVNAFPSLGGARFVFSAIFAVALIALDIKAKNLKSYEWLLHLLWALGFYWSVESAFFVCFMWWPYYLLIRLPEESDLRSIIFSVLTSAMRLLAVGALSVVLFCLGYFAIYRMWPIFGVYKLFVDYVRGPQLITYYGRFIFSVLIFLFTVVGLISNGWRNLQGYLFRNLFVLLMGAYGAYSYYIGRSADYNILPIMPYFLLILILIIAEDLTNFMRVCAVVLLLTSTGYMWTRPIAIPFYKSNIFKVDTAGLTNWFINECEMNQNNGDRGKAISYINSHFGDEGIMVFDHGVSLVTSGHAKDWNAYNNVVTYDGLPVDKQQEYIIKSKNKLMRRGWLVESNLDDKDDKKLAKDLFGVAYDIKEEVLFGSMTAYHLIPKASSATALK